MFRAARINTLTLAEDEMAVCFVTGVASDPQRLITHSAAPL